MTCGRIFGRTAAGHLYERRPDIRTNGGHIFAQTETGDLEKLRPKIQTNGGRQFI